MPQQFAGQELTDKDMFVISRLDGQGDPVEILFSCLGFCHRSATETYFGPRGLELLGVLPSSGKRSPF
jgi:hypothetical protein